MTLLSILLLGCLPSSRTCSFLPNSRALSGLIPSPSLLVNPIKKDMRIFCALIFSNGSISSSQLLTRAIAFSSTNLWASARSRLVAVDATVSDKRFIKDKWLNAWTKHLCADSPLRKHPPERRSFDAKIALNPWPFMTQVSINMSPVMLKVSVPACCSGGFFSILGHHLNIYWSSFRVAVVITGSKYVQHSVHKTWQMEREVCHALCKNEVSDLFYHIIVKSPKSWCSIGVIELLEHTLNLCWNHFSHRNFTRFNTILIVTSIVHRSLHRW